MKNLYLILSLLLIKSVGHTQNFKFPVDTLFKNGTSNKRINIVILGDGFTAAEMPKFIKEANKFMGYFLDSPAYNRCKDYFNFYAIKTPSNQSGATNLGKAPDFDRSQGLHAGQPIESKDTFYGCAFGTAGVHRLVGPVEEKYDNVSKVLANNFPVSDLTIMIVNTPWYGGAGGAFACYTLSDYAWEVAIHEIGHTFGNLADEYWAGASFGADERANRTRTKSPSTIKWKNWLNREYIGIFEHTGAGAAGWYKPTNGGCLMETFGVPYCAVCREGATIKILSLINPIETYLPTNATKTIIGSTPKAFSVNLLKPNPNSLHTEWSIDGKIIEKDKDQIFVAASQLPNKTGSKLTVTVFDTTEYIRTEKPEIDIKHSMSWTLEVEKATYASKLSVSSTQTAICVGESVMLTAKNCAGMLTWSNGQGDAQIIVSPLKTTTYTLNCASEAVIDTVNITIKVNPYPSAFADNKRAFFEGETVELIGSGDGDYNWTGPLNFTSIETNPKIPQATLANAGIYYLTVSKDNCSAMSSTKVFISLLLSTSPSSKSTQVIVFPNPADGVIKIDLSAVKTTAATTIELYDFEGRSILKRESTESTVEINIQSLASGTYLLKVNAGKYQSIHKIIKP